MGFTRVCVMIVIFIIIVIITGIPNLIDNDWNGTGWLLSSLGFAVCLTILLYEKGII